jgi:hypothetical protein
MGSPMLAALEEIVRMEPFAVSYTRHDMADVARAAIENAGENDLLNAAEQALADLVWMEGVGPAGTNLQASIILLRHAIAKARGE